MSSHRTGAYVGEHSELKGKRAMLWVEDDNVLAQFDDTQLCHPVTDAHLGYGTTQFPLTDFELDELVPWS